MREIDEVGAHIRILEILLDLDNFKEYLKVKRSYYKFDKYIKSYEFCLLFCIDGIFDIIIDYPEIFDLSSDLLIIRARQNRVIRDKFPRKSKLGILLSNINGLCNEIMKSKSEADLKDVLPKLKENLVIPINQILSNNYEVAKQYRENSKDELLKKATLFYFFLYFNDIHKIKISFNNILHKGKTFLAQSINIPLKLNEQLFFEGYKKIVDYVWQNLLRNQYPEYKFFSKMLKSRTWEEFDSYFEVLNHNLIDLLIKEGEVIDPIGKTLFRKKNDISNERFISLTQKELYSKKFRLTIKEKLDELFYWYPIRIIGSDLSVNNSTGFILLLLGMIKYGGDNIKILKIKHKYPYEYVYSFAILIEGFSIFADYSQWYLFLEFCSDGGGIEGQAYNEVMEYINKYRGKIDLKEYEFPPKSLDNYAADNLVKESIKEIRNLEEYKSLSKGKIFELFISYLFTNLGYNTKWALKKDFTSNKEIDLLAYKEYEDYLEFNVIEISTRDQDISSEIMTKIKILKKNKDALLDYLKLDSDKKCDFWGKLVTLKKSKIKNTKLIEVIDENKLREFSKKIDINFDAIKKLLVDERKKLSTDELIKYFDMNLYMNK